MTGRKLPAFGRDLAARLSVPSQWGSLVGTSSDGRNPQTWVLCGPQGWEIANRWYPRRLVVLLPPGDDPYRFDWRPHARFDYPIIVPCGHVAERDLYELADAILRDGSKRVLALSGHGVVRFLRDTGAEAA